MISCRQIDPFKPIINTSRHGSTPNRTNGEATGNEGGGVRSGLSRRPHAGSSKAQAANTPVVRSSPSQGIGLQLPSASDFHGGKISAEARAEKTSIKSTHHDNKLKRSTPIRTQLGKSGAYWGLSYETVVAVAARCGRLMATVGTPISKLGDTAVPVRDSGG